MDNKDIISTINTLYIVRDTLNGVDERLVGHGERVAYIVSQILKEEGSVKQSQLHELCLLSLLHDIGAYKTEEINAMLHFETTDCWAHSIYGYLFLKSFSPLKSMAEAVLYHHLPYMKYCNKPEEPLTDKYAQLLLLADRIDIIFDAKDVQLDTSYIEKRAEEVFSPYWINVFYAANKHYNILERLGDGSYRSVIDGIFSEIILSDDEKELFLSMAAYAIDFRSEFMVLHTITTVNVAKTIGKLFRLKEDELEELLMGALLHDIGKTGTPTQILEKPGKLTADEMKIMQEHVEISEKILRGRLPDKITEIAIRHHEKMDGSGYPYGLKGANLTLQERIVAVADILSALIRKRSYKEAFDTQQCRQVIMSMKEDGKICPEVADIVLKNIEAIIDVTNKEGERLLTVYYGLKREFEVFQSKGIHIH